MFSNFRNLETELNHRKSSILEQFKGVMVAHSGGLDSTTLLHCLWHFTNQKIKFPLSVYHVNFGLRGKDSDLDQSFSHDLATQLGLPFILRETTTTERQKGAKENTQEWARQLRYQDFRKYAEQGWLIALGHHQEDLAENVMLRLSRGCSVGGIAGMALYSPPFWRPLLTTGRAEIAEHARQNKLVFREDRTNAKLDYSRNRIRHKVMPELESMFPGAAKRIARTALEAKVFVDHAVRPDVKSLSGQEQVEALTAMEQPIAYEALTNILNLDPKLLSRHLLDSIWGQIKSNPNEPWIRQVSEGLKVVIDEKGIRTEIAQRRAWPQQHSRNLGQGNWEVVVDSGSYVILTAGVRELQIQSERLNPAIVKGYGASNNTMLRFKSANQGISFKNLMQRWDVSESARDDCFIVEIDGEISALWLNNELVAPGRTGEAEKVSTGVTVQVIKR